MKSADIRSAFLTYFEQQGHQVVESSSLIPGTDPTLLFTNAGMVQFKDVFLGDEQRAYNRAVSSQRCVRAGGKHNDLENVGYTARHHTFFEMLGNFSFGDYFKREAIRFGWEFLTEVLKLPAEKLWVTVHVSDDEAAAIWLDEMGVDPTRFSRLDEDNFWQMGDTGPCGPSSEIFYDHGPEVAGGPPGSPDDDGDRYIEIWNLVFMQYQRFADGHTEPLPNPSIDTGMGLERVAAIMQGVHNNYEIDLFQNLLDAAGGLLDVGDKANQSLRVIADHIRSCSFLILDGVLPSNEGRGYVLRRIIRRAVRHGNKLGSQTPFFHKLVAALVDEMGAAYPSLKANAAHIEKVLLAEEQQFAKTLDKGMAVLETAIGQLNSSELPGDLIFTLHDTYGFPTDLTNDIARERNLTLDVEGFEQCMSQQREKSKQASQFGQDYSLQLKLEGQTEFLGYTQLQAGARIRAILQEGEPVDLLSDKQPAYLILDQTPFYAESGGQIGDKGWIRSENGCFKVVDCQKQGDQFIHSGELESGQLSEGDLVQSEVDDTKRRVIAAHHSSTHLLHAALRKVLGNHVTQQGSLVNAERLRFDFSHYEAVTSEQLQDIEQLVNVEIRKNTAVQTQLMSMDQAKEQGAMALFGEKYSEEVRVLTMGDQFSVELCGGTHVARTGDIGMMKIVSESGVASGVRRIEAVSGEIAEHYVAQQQHKIARLGALIKADEAHLLDKAEQLVKQLREQQREIETLKSRLVSGAGGDQLYMPREANGVRFIAQEVKDMDPKSLRTMVDQYKNKLGTGVVVLGSVIAEDKVALVCGVSKDLLGRYHAGQLLGDIAAKVGGKAGGRPDMAQGGGNQPSQLAPALDSVEAML